MTKQQQKWLYDKQNKKTNVKEGNQTKELLKMEKDDKEKQPDTDRNIVKRLE